MDLMSPGRVCLRVDFADPLASTDRCSPAPLAILARGCHNPDMDGSASRRTFRRLVLGALLVALCASHAQARDIQAAQSRGGVVKAYDAVVLRPLGFIQTAVGATFFLFAYPISLATGGTDHVVDACITGPVDQTFERPLGEL